MRIETLVKAGVAVAALTIGLPSAFGALIDDTIFFGDQNLWRDNSAEVLIDNGGDPLKLDVGDDLFGVFKIEQANRQEVGGGSIDIDNDTNQSIMAIFSSRVVQQNNIEDVPVNGGTIEIADYVFGPTPGFEAEYGAGAMVAFFTDADKTLDLTTTVASAVADVVDGTNFLTIGLSGLDGDELWVANNAPTTPSVITAAIAQAAGTDIIIQLSELFNITGFTFALVDATVNLDDGKIQFNGGGTLFAANEFSDWDVQDNVQITFKPVPEPSTLALLGLGLLGFAGLRRMSK